MTPSISVLQTSRNAHVAFGHNREGMLGTDTAAQGDTSCGTVMVKKRAYVPLSAEARERKNARRRKGPSTLPPILKNDFRKFIPSMLANICNMRDSEMSSQFYRTLFRPDCKFIDYSRQSQYRVSLLTVAEGVDVMLKYFKEYDELSPDAVFHLHESQLRARHESATIISRVSYEGTVLWGHMPTHSEAMLSELLENGNSIVRSGDGLQQAVGPQADEVTALMSACRIGSSDVQPHLVPLECPISFHCDGFLIFDLDEEGVVTGLECIDSVAFMSYAPNQRAALLSATPEEVDDGYEEKT